MAILNIHEFTTGLVGISPKVIYIETDDTVATVTTTGYLNTAKKSGYQFSNDMMALVKTTTDVLWLEVSVSGGDVSLLAPINPSIVQLPVIDGHIAAFVGTTGLIGDDPAIAINGGNIQAGLSGTSGYLASFPTTATSGSLRLTAVANTGDTLVTVSNAEHGQATVISIPDGGQATTEFIIADSAGTQNITSGSLQVDEGDITAGSSGNAGVFNSFPGTAARGSLRVAAVNNAGDTVTTISNASMGQASVISIPDPGQATSEFIIADSAGTQNITSGSLSVDAGSVSSGLAAGGFAGSVVLHANTTASGNLAMLAVDNGTGDFDTVISNAAAVGQDQTITIPDAGAATANFLLDTGSANILTDYNEIVGINDILISSVGTWTRTRLARGDYALVKDAADDTSNVSFDITPAIRVAADKGFRLASFDVIYSIATDALDAHTVTLDEVTYANNTAVDVTSVAITGALATATQANPYVTNVAVDTPAFLVTADSKYVVELTVDAATTTDYNLYGLNLHFAQTVA